MAKKQMTASEQRFERNITALRDYMYQKELARRSWAQEKWMNVNGVWFKLCRVFIPLLSLYTIVSVIIYCLIRNAQLMMSEVTTGGIMPGLSYDAQTEYALLYIILMLVAAAALLCGNILLLRRHYKSGGIISVASGAAILLHILSQLFIPMPAGSIYQLFFGISCVVYLLLVLLCTYILLTLHSERSAARAAADYQLQKFAANGKMLGQDEYSDKIEQFLQKQNNDADSHCDNP